MKTLNKIIILLIIIIILIIVSLIFVLKDNEDGEVILDNEKVSSIEEVFETENKVQLAETKAEYFNVKECLDKYATYSNELLYKQEDYSPEYLEELKYKLPSIIPDFVKEKLQLNDENIYEKIGLPDKFIRIDTIYKSLQTISKEAYIESTNICAYIVKAVLIDRSNNQKEDLNIIILLDINNSTFLVIPQEYIKQEKISLEINSNFKIYDKETIQANQYNTFVYSEATEEDMSEEYFNRYRMNLIYDSEYIYNNLDEEYKQKRFENYEGFKKYIQSNKQELKTVRFNQYLVNYYDSYIEYVCKDQYGNLYIFNETSPMNFKLKLDTYTITTENFKREYTSSNEQEKVMMNIDKWVQMLNNRDYSAAYDVLDVTFKNNNFGSEDKFESYIKEKYSSHYSISFLSFSREANNTYVQNIKLTDISNNIEKEMTIIMQLKEGTDFVMSFDLK